MKNNNSNKKVEEQTNQDKSADESILVKTKVRSQSWSIHKWFKIDRGYIHSSQIAGFSFDDRLPSGEIILKSGSRVRINEAEFKEITEFFNLELQ